MKKRKEMAKPSKNFNWVTMNGYLSERLWKRLCSLGKVSDQYMDLSIIFTFTVMSMAQNDLSFGLLC